MIALTEALCMARNELAMANYMAETAPNAGLRTIFSNKADMLSTLIYAAGIYQKLLEGNKYG
jgi:hypothetical protein